MADRAKTTRAEHIEGPVDLDTAIARIEAGAASESLRVDLGDGLVACADGRHGLRGLLQRLRGHRMLMVLAQTGEGGSILPMRPGRPEIHPDVAAILDAVRNAS